MLSTEQTYVKNLEGMVNLYKKRFEEYFTAEEQRGKGVPKGFKRDHLKILFSNVHVVIPLNQQLLEELTERVNNWSESQKVGDIFLKIAPYFKLYNEYSNNYEASLECFDQLYTKDVQFIKLLEMCEAEAEGQGILRLENLLILPIQRVPRYNMLIADLIRKTDP